MDVLDFCTQLGKQAYKQEEKREQDIRKRADYLFKWLTFIVSIFNLSIPFIVKAENINYKNAVFIFLYVSIMILFTAAIILVVLAEYPQKKKYFPLGTELLKKAKEDMTKFTDETDLQYQSILYTDVMTKKMSGNNDRLVKLLKGAYLDLMLVMILMVIFILYILF